MILYQNWTHLVLLRPRAAWLMGVTRVPVLLQKIRVFVAPESFWLHPPPGAAFQHRNDRGLASERVSGFSTLDPLR